MRRILGVVAVVGTAAVVVAGVRRRWRILAYKDYVQIAHVYIGRVEVGDEGTPFRVYANQDLSVGQAEALLQDDDSPLFILLELERAGRMFFVLCDSADLILRLVGP